MFFLRDKLTILALTLATTAFAEQTQADLLAHGRVDEAISSLSARIENNTANAEDYHLLCRAHFDFQDWSAAVSACQKAVSLNPKSSRDHLWLGRAYGEKADSSSFVTAISLAKKVRSEFEEAVQLDPASVEARSDLGEFYLEAPSVIGGGRDKAAAQAEALDNLSRPKAHWIRGRIAEKNKDQATAETEYRSSIEASHGGGIDWLNLAFYYKRTQRFDEMEASLRKAVDAATDHFEIVEEAAETLIRQNRNLPLAVNWLQRYLAGPMVELAPAFRAHYWLGQAQERQGDRVSAAQSYLAALNLAKGYSRAKDALHRVDHRQ